MSASWEQAAGHYHDTSQTELQRLEAVVEALARENADLRKANGALLDDLADLRNRYIYALDRISRLELLAGVAEETKPC